MMQLDKDGAKELVQTRSKVYLNKLSEQTAAHEGLKEAIRYVRDNAGLTQQEIADATNVDGFDLSRQRISQILNEEDPW